MGYKLGDAVWWLSIVQSNKIERAGYIAAVVPAGHDPRGYAPDGTTCKVGGSFRTHESYLIKVPDVSYAFWPQVASLNLMVPEKEYILYSQPKSKTHFVLKAIDRRDRESIKDCARIFGADTLETKEMLEVREWRTRFWFAIGQGVEYILKVDRW